MQMGTRHLVDLVDRGRAARDGGALRGSVRPRADDSPPLVANQPPRPPVSTSETERGSAGRRESRDRPSGLRERLRGSVRPRADDSPPLVANRPPRPPVSTSETERGRPGGASLEIAPQG
ncbi:hypothetical protein AB1Y20_011362 [Prymnesium parvum]|uniref:Uncharacterized protein n=1 Tax=Prymnesium parvum TaxID=97485 RepID=A0AB34IN03_PRYPA